MLIKRHKPATTTAPTERAGSGRETLSNPASTAPYLRICVLTVLCLLAVFVLIPHLQTRFTTRDDTEIALRAAHPEGWISAALAMAISQGRFYQTVSMLGAYASHYSYFINPSCYYVIYLGSILLNVVAFYFLMRLVFASKPAALFATALSLAYLQNNWQHSLLTSYPGVPHLALTTLFCVFAFLLKWQQVRRRYLAILAGAAFLVSILMYETFVAYMPVFLALCVYHAWSLPGISLKRRTWVAADGMSAILVALVLYLGCYFLFRLTYPSQYEGSQLGSLSLSHAGAVIWQYTSSTFPAYFYFRDSASINATFDGFAPHTGGFWQLLEGCRAEWLAKAVIVSVFCLLILLEKIRLFTPKSFALALAGGFACLIAPVSLLSLTAKYQGWVLEHHSLAYSTASYYAYFAMIFLIGTILLFINQQVARNRVLFSAYLVLAIAAIATVSLATDYYNYYITLDQQLSQLKWRTLDRFAQTDEFRALPNDSVIYAPSLWRYRGIVSNSETYWTAYLSQKSGKTIEVVQTARQFQALTASGRGRQGYFLAFEQEPKDADQFVVFSKLGEADLVTDGLVHANEFSLFTYSRNRTFTLVGECSAKDRSVTVEIDGQVVEDVAGSTFFGHVDLNGARGDFPRTRVKATASVDIAHLIVSYFPVEPGRKGVEIVYGRGFHGLEGNAGAGLVWNWSLGQSELFFVNHSDHAVEKSIRFTLTTFTARTINLEIHRVRRAVRFEAGGAQPVEMRIVLEPGENRFYLASDQPAQPPGNGDTRLMAFGVQNLAVIDPDK